MLYHICLRVSVCVRARVCIVQLAIIGISIGNKKTEKKTPTNQSHIHNDE